MDQGNAMKMILDELIYVSTHNGRLQFRISELENEVYELQQKVEVSPPTQCGLTRKQIVDLLVMFLTVPNERINQIKMLRELTGKGLKESKELTEEVWLIVNSHKSKTSSDSPFHADGRIKAAY